jgi:hypothetical protein
LKSNIGKDEGGLNYDIVGVPVEVDDEGKTVSVEIGRIVWGAESQEVVTSALISHDKKVKTKKLTKIEQAMVWLAGVMVPGKEYAAAELSKAGVTKGFSKDTLHSARKQLGITSVQKPEGWFWTYGTGGIQ